MNEKNTLLKLVQLAKETEKEETVLLSELKAFSDRYIVLRIVKQGEKITREDVVISRVYLVVRGKFIESRSSENGKENMLIKRKAPQFIGVDRAVTPKRTKMTSMIATEPCIIIEIDRNYFLNSLKSCGELGIEVLKNICEKITDEREIYDKMLFLSSQERLILYIVEHYEAFHVKKKNYILHENNTQIANGVGISVRTLQRLLNGMRKEGMIDMVKGEIQVNERQFAEMKKKINMF